MFGHPGKHFWADLFTVMKGENIIRPTFTGQDPMGTVLAFQDPADPEQGRQDLGRFASGPGTHAALRVN